MKDDENYTLKYNVGELTIGGLDKKKERDVKPFQFGVKLAKKEYKKIEGLKQSISQGRGDDTFYTGVLTDYNGEVIAPERLSPDISDIKSKSSLSIIGSLLMFVVNADNTTCPISICLRGKRSLH